MSGDKNRKILWFFTALIILFAAIIIPTVLNQGSNEGEDNSGSLDKSTPMQATPTMTANPTETQTSTPLQSQDEVRFTVYVDQSDIEDCGWTCREIPATLTNTGDETAHNVNVDIRFYCDGDQIDVNGKEYLSLDLGTMDPGESETRTKEIDVGFGGGLCIQNNGARIVFTVTSDEKTMTLEETYNP